MDGVGESAPANDVCRSKSRFDDSRTASDLLLIQGRIPD